jgi:hypothetical protein
MIKKIEDLPVMQAARNEVAMLKNHIDELEKALPGCVELRAQLRALDDAGDAISQDLAMWRKQLAQAEAKVSKAETALNMAKNNASEIFDLERNIARLEAQLAVTDNTLDLGQIQFNLQRDKAALQRALGKDSNKKLMADAAARAADLAKEQAELVQMQNLCNPHIERLGNESIAKMKQRETTRNALSKAGDVLPIDIERAKANKAVAEQAIENARVTAQNQLNAELLVKQKAAEAAANDLEAAENIASDIWAHIVMGNELLDMPLTPSRSVGERVVENLGAAVKYPFTIASEIIFGVGQSPQEIGEILRSGKENVQLLKSRKHHIDRAVREHHERRGQLKRELEYCIKMSSPDAQAKRRNAVKSVFPPPKVDVS